MLIGLKMQNLKNTFCTAIVPIAEVKNSKLKNAVTSTVTNYSCFQPCRLKKYDFVFGLLVLSCDTLEICDYFRSIQHPSVVLAFVVIRLRCPLQLYI